MATSSATPTSAFSSGASRGRAAARDSSVSAPHLLQPTEDFRVDNLRKRVEVPAYCFRSVERRLRWFHGFVGGVVLLSLLSLADLSQAADFSCAAGDVACLIAAINT